MKKTNKLLSVMVLLGQVVSYAPTVLADDKQQNIVIEKSTMINIENTASVHLTSEELESSTTDSSENSIGQSINESSDSTEDSTTDSTETNEAKPETGTSSTSDYDQEEHSDQEETRPSETSREETPSTSTDQSTQEETTKSKEAAEKSEDSVQGTTISPSSIVTEQQSNEARPNEEGLNEQASSLPIQVLVRSSDEVTEGNIYFEKNESIESFVRKIGESARKIGQEKDLYASVMIAQAILESASGESQLAQAPNYNLFGIKGTYKGKGVFFDTQEDLGNGVLYTTQAIFRQYENYEGSLTDYAKLLKEGLTGNSYFYEGVWKSNAKTYQEATKFLVGRYATDADYDKKLNGLIEAYDLTTYDKEGVGPQLNREGYIVPLKNYTISSLFGARDGEFHRGIDLAAVQGEPIYASKAGVVIKAEYHPSWGNYVVIQHEDGTTALYAHQQQYQVKAGDKIAQGEIIGYVGSTGNSTGSHLHFELCLDSSLNQSQLINPESVLF